MKMKRVVNSIFLTFYGIFLANFDKSNVFENGISILKEEGAGLLLQDQRIAV